MYLLPTTTENSIHIQHIAAPLVEAKSRQMDLWMIISFDWHARHFRTYLHVARTRTTQLQRDVGDP